jgi:transposase
MERKAYPSDISDEEWGFVAPYLTLMTEEAPQRDHSLREVFNGLRWMVRAGASWPMIPHDLAPWWVVYQQTQRWIKAGVFEAMVHDLRTLLRLAQGRKAQPSAVILDSRTLQSTPRAACWVRWGQTQEGLQNPHGGGHAGRSVGLLVTPANEQDRDQVQQLTSKAQEVTGETVEVALVDEGYTGEKATQAAEGEGIRLEVIKLPDVKKGFVLLPRRWVFERSFGWAARFRWLARDYERLPETLIGLNFLALAILMA